MASVDKMTAKTVKLDPKAYEYLSMTKLALKKYLKMNMSYSDTVRWLCQSATGPMGDLRAASVAQTTHLVQATGQSLGPGYPSQEPNYIEIMKNDFELEKDSVKKNRRGEKPQARQR